MTDQRENIIFVCQSNKDKEVMEDHTAQVIQLIDSDKVLAQKIVKHCQLRRYEAYLKCIFFGKFDFSMNTVGWPKVLCHLALVVEI